MDEFINRQEAIEQAKAEWAKLPLSETTGFGIFMRVLTSIPAADVRPVVKAYWIGEGDGYADGEMVYDVWHCSNCDYTVDEGDNEPPQYNFCPNCGADMREES